MIRIALVMFLLLSIVSFTGCREQRGGAYGGKLEVTATLFPVYDFARAVGGDKVDVRLLLPPGIEPHNYEPKPEEVVRISHASLFIYTDRWMEPWAPTLLKGAGENDRLTVVEAGRGVPLLPEEPAHNEDRHGHHRDGGFDPHIWLDPLNAQVMVDTITAALAGKDPANADYYRTRASRYKAELAALDEKFRNGLATCRKRTFLHGGHYAFSYLARRYNLTYRSAYAVSANAEPTPNRLVDLVKEMKRLGLKHVFTEELISPAMANTIARETGAEILKLHGIHNVSKADLDRGVTYLSLMDENLANLRKGLECR